MNEIERAERYADSFIHLHERQIKLGISLPIINPDYIWEHKDFQEMVIQHIRIKEYKVMRINDDDGLALKLNKE